MLTDLNEFWHLDLARNTACKASLARSMVKCSLETGRTGWIVNAIRDHQTATPTAAAPSSMISLLFFGYLLSYGDRFVFGMVLQPIKLFLHLTDSQAGLLAGIAFAATYALFSPFAGYLVDRVSRKAIFLFAIAFWSCATFSCGLVTTPLSMGIACAAVGAGEALMIPLAVSVIGDTVALASRAKAMAFFFTGGPIGSLSVLLFGGMLLRRLGHRTFTLPFVGTKQPWQCLFLSLALPGLLLCIAVLLRMKELPHQREHENRTEGGVRSDAVWSFLRENRVLCTALFVGFPLLQMSGVAVAGWAFIYFDRVYGMPMEQAAIAFSFTASIATIVGCLLSGRLIGLLRKRGYVDASLRACLLGGVLFSVFAAFGLLAPGPKTALALFSAAFFFSYVPTVGGFSAVSEMTPPAIRASIAGLNTLTVGLLTTSLGPYLVGSFSDHFFHGRLGIRWAMLSTLAVSVLFGAAFVFPGLKPLRSRIEELNHQLSVTP